MERRDQVCTLAQAKKLVQLGVIQEAIFFHIEINGFTDVYQRKTAEQRRDKYDRKDGDDSHLTIYPAYNIAELWLMLNELPQQPMTAKTGALIMAAELIKRIEEGILQVSEVNERLLPAKEHELIDVDRS